MLKYRLLTALIAVPLIAFIILVLPPGAFILTITFVALWGAYEWGTLLSLSTMVARWIYVLIVALFMLLIPLLPHSILISTPILLWILMLGFVLTFPKTKHLWNSKWVLGMLGVLMLCAFWYALVVLRAYHHGKLIIAYFILLIFAADTGAYTFGKLLGRHKLIPTVSPGKTWEGLLGGLLFGFMMAIGTGLLVQFSWVKWGIWGLITLITVLVSVLGDLTISMMKRNCCIKDIGGCLPGHGGLLDRLDSLMAALPIFTLLFVGFHLIP